MGDAKHLRVLFWMRDSRDVPGGPRVQMTKTAEAVADLGHEVHIATEERPSFRETDVVHAFGVDAAGLREARRAGCIVAVSTIYNPIRFTHGLDRPRPPWELALWRGRTAAAGLAAAVRGEDVLRAQRATARITRLQLAFECADVLLPNAQGELEDLYADLGVSTPGVVVPNAIDDAIFCAAEPPPFEGRDGVLCVGRLEPHKNQLALAHACRALDVALTLVGPEHPHHRGYLAACQEANPLLRWVPECSQTELVEHYDRARVHALCSWFETTGLSSLEAAARGCAVVSTARGYAKEYLAAWATYCDPGSRSSIFRAIAGALRASPDRRLQSSVATQFTWRNAGAQTIVAYGGESGWCRRG